MRSRTAATGVIAALLATAGALFPSGAGADTSPVTVTTTQTGTGVAVCQSGCVQVVTVVNLALVVIYVGVPPASPSLRLTPRALDFGVVRPGRSGPLRLVTLMNTGRIPVVVEGAGVAGPQSGDFAVHASSCLTGRAIAAILQPRAGCAIGVVFSPAAPGHRKALLSVIVDGRGYGVRLTGRGAVPAGRSSSPAHGVAAARHGDPPHRDPPDPAHGASGSAAKDPAPGPPGQTPKRPQATPIVVPAALTTGPNAVPEPPGPVRPPRARWVAGGGAPHAPPAAVRPSPIVVRQPAGVNAARLASAPAIAGTPWRPLLTAARMPAPLLPAPLWSIMLLTALGVAGTTSCVRAARMRRHCGLFRL